MTQLPIGSAMALWIPLYMLFPIMPFHPSLTIIDHNYNATKDEKEIKRII
jgi:hypothetical protein